MNADASTPQGELKVMLGYSDMGFCLEYSIPLHLVRLNEQDFRLVTQFLEAYLGYATFPDEVLVIVQKFPGGSKVVTDGAHADDPAKNDHEIDLTRIRISSPFNVQVSDAEMANIIALLQGQGSWSGFHALLCRLAAQDGPSGSWEYGDRVAARAAAEAAK